MANKNQIHCRAEVKETATAFQLLTEASGLPGERIKRAMVKGAVWLKRPGSGERRLRKAKFLLQPGDEIKLFYDPDILEMTPPCPTNIAEESSYSVWFKPTWMLTQGTRYGDHCSLLRAAEKNNRAYDYKLIHRLDREACGLVILAHNRNGAKLLSALFQNNEIEKRYYAEVQGVLDIGDDKLILDSPIDGKIARTEIISSKTAGPVDNSLVDIRLHTGRLHQIRRHLADAGHPIVGDTQYGSIRSRTRGELHLCAWKIAFNSPFTGRKCSYQVPVNLCPSFLGGPPLS